MRLLPFTLLALGSLAILHLVMSRRGPSHPIAFCAAGAAAHVVIGLGLFGPMLAAQNVRSLTTLAWWPVMALGFFCAGAIASVAWLAAFRGLDWYLQARSQR